MLIRRMLELRPNLTLRWQRSKQMHGPPRQRPQDNQHRGAEHEPSKLGNLRVRGKPVHEGADHNGEDGEESDHAEQFSSRTGGSIQTN
jgi:hypothetical protein